MCTFSRKPCFSSDVQHKNKNKTNNSLCLCLLDAGRLAEGKGHETDSVVHRVLSISWQSKELYLINVSSLSKCRDSVNLEDVPRQTVFLTVMNC